MAFFSLLDYIQASGSWMIVASFKAWVSLLEIQHHHHHGLIVLSSSFFFVEVVYYSHHTLLSPLSELLLFPFTPFNVVSMQ